jgi:type II secretory pathway pseudopilin PulG
MSVRVRSVESGFTILELIVAMAVTLVVLGGTTQVLSDAMNAQLAAKQMLDMNAHLRAAMDLMHRDMLQAGQGLPVGRRVETANGAGAQPIRRPGPAARGGCAGVANFEAEPTLPAVTVGAELGPPVDGECTDVVTVMAADNMFGSVPVASIAANGRTLVIHNSVTISDNPDAAGDNLRAGDLLMLTKGTSSSLMQVTAVAGQTVTFGTGAPDPLRLNQFDTTLAMQGTINQHKATAPVDPNAPVVVGGVQQVGPSLATRIRMVTYFVDTLTNPVVPRLVRAMAGANPTAVAIGVQGLRYTYDLADENNNPTNVRMNDGDLDGSGDCSPDLCSVNQIRKVNILLTMRSDQGRGGVLAHGRQSQNTLYAQVSLRSMAFVDRYR